MPPGVPPIPSGSEQCSCQLPHSLWPLCGPENGCLLHTPNAFGPSRGTGRVCWRETHWEWGMRSVVSWEPRSWERYSLWEAGLPKVNIGTPQGRHWSVCLRERPYTGDVVAAGAVGAGAHDVRCCGLASGMRKGEKTTRDELDTEMYRDVAKLYICYFRAGCWWTSRWKGGHRRSNGLRDLDIELDRGSFGCGEWGGRKKGGSV